MTWEIRRDVVNRDAADDVLRLLNLDLLRNGWDTATLNDWVWSQHGAPHLKWDPLIVALAESLPADWRTGVLCDPQILVQFPHTGEIPAVTPHLDREPEWAHGRRYRRIVGVPLTSWAGGNGGLQIAMPGLGMYAPNLDMGDAVMLSPDQPHSGGVNLTGAIRYGIYFRWLHD